MTLISIRGPAAIHVPQAEKHCARGLFTEYESDKEGCVFVLWRLLSEPIRQFDYSICSDARFLHLGTLIFEPKLSIACPAFTGLT